MTIDTPHTELWSAIAVSAAATAGFLIRMGADWGKVLTKLDDLHANQQVLATKAGVELPHPFVKK